MNLHILFVLCIPLVFGSVLGADFRNLNFDSPDLSHLTEIQFSPPPRTFQVGNAADLFRGWSVQLDHQTYIGQVLFKDGFPDIPMLLVNAVSATDVGYSPYFIPSILTSPNGLIHRFSLSQIGAIPVSASELFTKGNGFVYINGELLTFRFTGNFQEDAWDVSKYAGQNVELELRNYSSTVVGSLDLDIIGFNVPEPSEWALLVAGGGLLCWAIRKSS